MRHVDLPLSSIILEDYVLAITLVCDFFTPPIGGDRCLSSQQNKILVSLGEISFIAVIRWNLFEGSLAVLSGTPLSFLIGGILSLVAANVG